MKFLSNLFSPKKVSKPVKSVKAMSGAHYKIVQGDDIHQRDTSVAEVKNEYEILDIGRRLKLLDACRQAVRNSPAINAILKNFDNCVIGPDGFKMIWSGDDTDEIRKLKRLFKHWTRDCGFFGHENFRTILSILLENLLISGDVCLVVDTDNLFRNSSKILLFESDEIGSIPQNDFQKMYGKNHQQILGIALNQFGQEDGIILSKSQRGLEVFESSKSYCLKMDVDRPIFDSPYLHVKYQPWRTNAIRGISPLVSSIASAEDLEMVCANEIAVSKKSSQILAQIYDTQEKTEEQLPSAFDGDIDSMTDDEIKAAIEAEQSENHTVSFEKVRSCGAQVIQMPDGKKIEALDFSHPNLDVVAFIEQLQSRITSPLGVAGYYSTYNPSSDSKLAQMMSWQTFYSLQKQIEQVCDYIFYKFVKFQVSKGEIDETKLPEDWEFYVKWSHPTMESLDENQNQDSIAKKISNMTGNYSEILGPDWKEKLEQTAFERKWMEENGITPPAELMKSGGQTEASKLNSQESE